MLLIERCRGGGDDETAMVGVVSRSDENESREGDSGNGAAVDVSEDDRFGDDVAPPANNDWDEGRIEMAGALVLGLRGRPGRPSPPSCASK